MHKVPERARLFQEETSPLSPFGPFGPRLARLAQRATTLQLAFESKLLRTICENESEATRELGATAAGILKHRLADLQAATSVKDLIAGRPRVLKGPDCEYMAVDLCDGYRMVFTANHPNNPVTKTNDLDWSRVTRIKILRIERDHG